QAGTEVVRVLHAVEHQYQRAAFGGLDQLRQSILVPGAGRCVARERALVGQPAGDAVQRLLRHPTHLDAEAARVALDLGDPRIPRPRLEQHLAHVLRVMLDRRSHRIDPRHPLTVLAHRDLERHIFQPQISLILKGFVRSRPASDPPTGQRTPQSQSFFHLWNLWLVFALLALVLRLAGWPRGGGVGGSTRPVSTTRRKSILRSSRLALSTTMRTRSPRRYSPPRRSPVSVLRIGSKR